MNENGVGSIEHYMYEEHELLRPAAVECMCNLVMFEEVGEPNHTLFCVAYPAFTRVSRCRSSRCFWERTTA